MLKIGARHIIPSLLMCSPEERHWAAVVIGKIREAMKMQKEYLGAEVSKKIKLTPTVSVFSIFFGTMDSP